MGDRKKEFYEIVESIGPLPSGAMATPLICECSTGAPGHILGDGACEANGEWCRDWADGEHLFVLGYMHKSSDGTEWFGPNDQARNWAEMGHTIRVVKQCLCGTTIELKGAGG